MIYAIKWIDKRTIHLKNHASRQELKPITYIRANLISKKHLIESYDDDDNENMT